MVAYDNFMHEMQERAPNAVVLPKVDELMKDEKSQDPAMKDNMVRVHKMLEERREKEARAKEWTMTNALKPRPPVERKKTASEKRREAHDKAEAKRLRMIVAAEQELQRKEEEARAKILYREKVKVTGPALVLMRRFLLNIRTRKRDLRCEALAQAKKEDAALASIGTFFRKNRKKVKSDGGSEETQLAQEMNAMRYSVRFLTAIRIRRKRFNIRKVAEFLKDCQRTAKYKNTIGLYVRHVKVLQRFVRRWYVVQQARRKVLLRFWQNATEHIERREALKRMRQLKAEKMKGSMLKKEGRQSGVEAGGSSSSTDGNHSGHRPCRRQSVADIMKGGSGGGAADVYVVKKLASQMHSLESKAHELALDVDIVHAKHRDSVMLDAQVAATALREVLVIGEDPILETDNNSDDEDDDYEDEATLKRKEKEAEERALKAEKDVLIRHITGILKEKRRIHVQHMKEGFVDDDAGLAPCSSVEALKLVRNDYDTISEEVCRVQLYSLMSAEEKLAESSALMYFRPYSDKSLGHPWLHHVEEYILQPHTIQE